jgi:hypothetical protein
LSDTCATVTGGWNNSASKFSFVGGGSTNTASGYYATVAGGLSNTASGYYATVAGGLSNIANNTSATVSGGLSNTASDYWATVGGGTGNTASGYIATVGGGANNTASGYVATVGGGAYNTANGSYTAVYGGRGDTTAGNYGFTAGEHSVVPSGWFNSVAFNGTTASGHIQLRCYWVVQGFAGFAVDHPLDPEHKILNQYSMNSSEAVMFYRGSAMIDSNGRVDVQLPDYFDALNKNPMIQLTGVGTSDVYIAEDVSGNHFAIGGKPGTKVYWTVTGERKDETAEICKVMTPVEQPKTGALAGRSLDDVGLIYGKDLLDKNGDGKKYQFRTEEGRKRYNDMKALLEMNK